MYTLRQFGRMIADSVRMDAYQKAIQRAVKPGDVVVDIGAGTGIFSLMACQQGAKHVYAIEPNPLVNLGSAMAGVNGFRDRITFMRAMSTQVDLPEKADVILGDIHGVLPPFDQVIGTFRDARERLMKPGGVVIPARDLIYVSLIDAPAIYEEEIVIPWKQNDFGVRMDTVMPMVVNTMIPHTLRSPVGMLPPVEWTKLDYVTSTRTTAPNPLTWRVASAMTLHFLVLWFDVVLMDDIIISNAPNSSKTPDVYHRLLLPLQSPIDVSPGDTLTLDLRVDPFNNDYSFRWNTRLYPPGETEKPTVDYKQSNYYSLPLVDMHKRAVSYIPKIKPGGVVTARTLTIMQQGKPLGEVARAIQAEFPEFFGDQASALAFAANLSQQYSS